MSSPRNPGIAAGRPGPRDSSSDSVTRTETDPLGAKEVPADALYGAQTQRAVENFPISGEPLPPELIHAIGLVKLASARVNRELGTLTVVITHNADIARMATRVMALADGRIVRDEANPARVAASELHW